MESGQSNILKVVGKDVEEEKKQKSIEVIDMKNNDPDDVVVVVNVDDDNDDDNDDDDDDDEDEDDVIDDEQVEEFKEQLESLGSYPDKVMINTLTMIAADYKDSYKSALKLYTVWKHRLLQTTGTTNVHEKMPIIYVLDSILKNIHQNSKFRKILENDYEWIKTIYYILPSIQQEKLYKVYMTWKEYNIFSSDDKWKLIGECFTSKQQQSSSSSTSNVTTNTTSTSSTTTTTIPRNTKDGSLILAKNLRIEMQNILDDMQTDITNELDKVSLERLADINPDLLMNIKRAAEDGIKLISNQQQQQQSTNNNNNTSNRRTTTTTNSNAKTNGSSISNSTVQVPSFITEMRTDIAVQRSNEWYNVLQQQQASQKSETTTAATSISPIPPPSTNSNIINDITESIQKMIVNGCTDTSTTTTTTSMDEKLEEKETKLYTQRDAIIMMKYYATASAISQLLIQQHTILEQSGKDTMNQITDNRNNTNTISSDYNNSNMNNNTILTNEASSLTNFLKVNIHVNDFTNDGIKHKNTASISLLYEIGLPYQSTIDGKRFRTQQQLSNHLDYIFQMKQKNKFMKMDTNNSGMINNNQERGWYIYEKVWTFEEQDVSIINPNTSLQAMNDDNKTGLSSLTNQNDDMNNETDPNVLYTVPADETRDTCMICGLRFVMFFDSNEGQYKYRNCYSIRMKSSTFNDHDVGLDDDDDDENDAKNDENEDVQFIHGTCWIGLGQPETLSYDQTIHKS